jgi:arylsulfatase A-like enzyme
MPGIGRSISRIGNLGIATILSIFVLALASFIVGCGNENAAKFPNIVIILADDFGVGDIQAHYPDNKIATPHLDRFSTQSMRFTNAHSGSAVCTPTRYGLLTGRYAWRTALQEWVLACYEPPLIDAKRLTLPEFLRDNGYKTACIGKWHLGMNWPGPQPSTREQVSHALKDKEWDYAQPIQDGPIARGFDYYFGVDLPNYPPFTFVENDRVVEQPTARYQYDADEGVVMPRTFDGSPMAPGWQFDRILSELTSRAVQYIHEQAENEEPFFLYFSQTSPHEPVVPSENFKDKSGIAPIADFVMETDWSAGQVIQALEAAGIADNTLVIFTADNGHSHYTGWDELVNAGHLPSGEFRGHKSNIWEGGHRVPFLVRWPGQVDPGKTSDQILSLNDVFATCAEIVGKELPPNAAEDSFSFLSSILGKSDEPHRDHVVSHSVGGEFAYMEGSWKIVFKNELENRNQCRGKARIVELYNLDDDIAECKNLAEEEPEKLTYLAQKLRDVIARGTSRPGPNQSNDTEVVIDVTQTQRWGAEIPQ